MPSVVDAGGLVARSVASSASQSTQSPRCFSDAFHRDPLLASVTGLNLYVKELGSSRSSWERAWRSLRWSRAIWRLHQSCGGSVSGPGASVFCGVELKLPLALLVVNTNGNNIFRGQ